jgi:hypothetical protein
MPNRSRKTKPEPAAKRTAKPQQKRDENQMAFDTLQQIMKQTEGTGKNPLAVALGRLGGLKGGRARAEKLSESERSESASKAAKARWAAKRNSEK